MTYRRLAKLFGYVVAARQTCRHRSSLATEIMTFVPPTAVSRLGLASTFILGAAVGNQLKKHKDQLAKFTHEERRKLHVTSGLNKDFTMQKQCDVISQVHRTLQDYSLASSADDSITNFYVDRARKLCHTYLSSFGLLEMPAEISLENWFEDSEWVDNTDHWPRLPALRSHSPPSYSSTLLASVTAIWYISRVREKCRGKAFVNADLLRMLKQIIEDNDESATPIILKIFANISAVQENRHLFLDTGLIDIFEKYSENSLSELFLPAWRGLHNLRQANGKTTTDHEVYVEGVYPFNPPYLDKAEDPVLDIILVHGIKGRASWTWRQHDQEKSKPLISQEQRRNILTGRHQEEVDALYTCCWPLDWLVASLDIPVRILAVDYDAEWQTSGNKCALEARGKTISEHATDIAESLKVARVGDRPIVWISHSMGGLIVKHMMVNDFSKESPLNKEELPKDMHILQEDPLSLNRLARQSLGVVFFSVPHHGAPLASYVSKPVLRQVLQPTTEVCEMKAESSKLSEVHKSFIDIAKANGTDVLTLNESQPMKSDLGVDIYFVPSKYADPGIGSFHEVDASHLDICKPLNRKSESYLKVAAFIQDVIKNV